MKKTIIIALLTLINAATIFTMHQNEPDYRKMSREQELGSDHERNMRNNINAITAIYVQSLNDLTNNNISTIDSNLEKARILPIIARLNKQYQQRSDIVDRQIATIEWQSKALNRIAHSFICEDLD